MTAPHFHPPVAARPTCTIRRLDASYSLPESCADAASRLDRALRSMPDEMLDAALERAGVPLADEICVRTVRVDARLSVDVADWDLERDWSLAVADAIAGEVRRGGANVVRYGSRQHALLDVVSSASRGDARRAWAWRQLTIWHGGENDARAVMAARALDALTRDAHLAAAVLADVARRGELAALVELAPAARWAALERAALAAAGIDASVPASRDASTDIDETPFAMRLSGLDDARDFLPSSDRALSTIVERIVRRSDIARAARGLGAMQSSVARALATLAALEVAPEMVVAGSERVRAIRSRLALSTEGVVQHDGQRDARRDTPRPTHELPTRLPRGRSVSPAATRNSDEDSLPPDVRTRAFTRAGGLLFLLHLVRDGELPSRVVADPVLAHRGLTWTLHQLGVSLAKVDERDAAVLAFCGLRPSDDPPSRDEPPTSNVEREAIAAYRALIMHALIVRLGASAAATDAATDHESLLASVVRRRGDILADPAWIEARFALDEVSVPVRRAGLDLNLDWLPWLGVVMRFVYE